MNRSFFSSAWWESVKLSYTHRGPAGVIPWWFLLLVVFPCSYVRYFHPEAAKLVDANSIPILIAGCVAGLGMLGAMTVNLMGQVVGIVSDEKFSSFLKDTGTFSITIFVPQFTMGTIFVSLFFLLMTYIFFIIPVMHLLLPYMAIVSLGLIAYAALNVWSLIDLARKLAWHRRDYTTKLNDEIERLKNELARLKQ